MARSEATKQSRARGLPLGDCFAALAMTTPHVQADRLLVGRLGLLFAQATHSDNCLTPRSCIWRTAVEFATDIPEQNCRRERGQAMTKHELIAALTQRYPQYTTKEMQALVDAVFARMTEAL